MSYKLSDNNKLLLLDINFRTALLESVDWDEEQSNSLLSFLQESLRETSMFPDEILNYVKQNFGEAAHALVKKMFVDAYIENGLYTQPGDDYEH